MSIEMDNPTTIIEKVDALSNLIEQIELSHKIHDEATFVKVTDKARHICWSLLDDLEKESE